MYGLKVRIRNVIDAGDPVSVECVMTELNPMIPGDGIIRCSVQREAALFAEIDTSLPDGVESTMGQTRFKVHPQDLSDSV